MHHARLRCVPFLFPVIILLAAACIKNTPEKNAPASTAARTIFPLDDSLPLVDACERVSAYLCSVLGSCDTSLLGLFNMSLDSAVSAIKKNIGDKKTGPEALDAILSAVYTLWNIGFDPRDSVVETLLPHLVFKNRKGACVGVSLIILMLAASLHCPVFGVMPPGHFFCRYDDGNLRINIEPNKHGYAHPDGYYLKRYPCEHRPGYGLANLDRKAIVGVLCYNAGALCLKQKQYDAAIACYRECLRRVPDFYEAQGNCAIAFAKGGNLDTALVLFEKLFAAHPDMVNLAVNFGYVATAAKQYSLAITVYKKGLEYYPDDTVLRKRLEKLTGGLRIFPIKRKQE